MADGATELTHRRPSKRLKTIKACAQCTSAKTRCDDHTSAGCGRCAKLNKACSLKDDLAYLAQSVGRTGSPSVTPGVNDATAARIAELEARVNYLEAHLTGQPSYSAGRSSSTTTTGIFSNAGLASSERTQGLRARPEADDIRTTMASIYMPPDYDFLSVLDFEKRGPQRRPIEERSVAIVDTRGFPDILKRGLLTSSQIAEAFLQWKHRFSTVAPLAPFLLTSSPLPSHPFTVAVIVRQTTFGQTPGIVETVNEGFARLMAGDVIVDAMLGLLILAIDGHRNSPVVPSAVRVIAAAYEISRAAGLEAWAARYASMDQAQRMLWSWETVKQYYNVIHLHHTRIPTILPFIAKALQCAPSQHYHPVITHITLIERTHQCLVPFLDVLVDLEYRVIYSSPELSALHDAWRLSLSRIDQLDPSLLADQPSQLFVHSTLSSIAHRVLSLIHLIPTPTHPALLAPPIDAWGTVVCGLSTRLINLFLDWDHEAYPVIPHVYLGRIIGAVITYLLAHITTLRHVPAYLGANMESARKAEDKLLSMGGLGEYSIQRVRRFFGSQPGERIVWPGLSELDEEVSGGMGGVGALDAGGLDGAELDLSAWSWLFEGVTV